MIALKHPPLPLESLLLLCANKAQVLDLEVTWIAAPVARSAIRNRKEKRKKGFSSFCPIISNKCYILEAYRSRPADKGAWKMYLVGFKPVL